ncbi:MAG: hypothetical protein ACE5HT_00450 [Gemmatimonadales bacterium]
MARRTIEVDGERWAVYPSGRVTLYSGDEFGLIFEKGTGPDRVSRVTRFSPQGARRRDAALAELSDTQLVGLLRTSQIARTSPETGYRRRTV